MKKIILSTTEKALIYATAAHGAIGQKRKYSGEPYINHCIEVADLVYDFSGSSEAHIAAYLHDVVEDTKITISDIVKEFGLTIGEIVEGLTDVSTPADGNRAARKVIDRAALAAANRDVQFVKCADIISNTKDIVENDPDFAKVYIEELDAHLEVFDKVKNCAIYWRARKAIDKGIIELL